MIEINLLPQEYRKKEPRFKGVDISQLNLQNIPVMGIIVGIVIFLVVVQVLVFALRWYGTSRVVALKKRYEELAPRKQTYDGLKARERENARKIRVIDELMEQRFSWSRKLNALSDSVTPGIWLTSLSYGEAPPLTKDAAPARTLVLVGYAAGAGEKGAALVGKFIKSMKDNEEFFRHFSDIALGSIRSERVEGQEVMNFRITCLFKGRGA